MITSRLGKTDHEWKKENHISRASWSADARVMRRVTDYAMKSVRVTCCWVEVPAWNDGGTLWQRSWLHGEVRAAVFSLACLGQRALKWCVARCWTRMRSTVAWCWLLLLRNDLPPPSHWLTGARHCSQISVWRRLIRVRCVDWAQASRLAIFNAGSYQGGARGTSDGIRVPITLVCPSMFSYPVWGLS